jgi:hypothetical protein
LPFTSGRTPGNVPGRTLKVQLYIGPLAIGSLFPAACTKTDRVEFGTPGTRLATNSLVPTSDGSRTQLAGFTVNALLGKLMSLPVPATNRPALSSDTVMLAEPPASAMLSPMSMLTT